MLKSLPSLVLNVTVVNVYTDKYLASYFCVFPSPTSSGHDLLVSPHLDPAVLPALMCPDYLTLEVNSSMPYNITLADHITAEFGTMLTYSSGPVLTVGPGTVGKTAVRVMATDMYGFESQCAFIVDIMRE